MIYLDIDITVKSNFRPNMLVDINNNGIIERGWIEKVLSSGNSSDGIKVQLTNGSVGRIYGVPNKNDLERKNFKFYNLLMNNNEIYMIFDKKENKLFVLKNVYIYLFSNKEIAEEGIKNTVFDSSQFVLQRFPSVTKLLKYIEKNNLDYHAIVIDKTRQLSKSQFEDVYKRFYNC